MRQNHFFLGGARPQPSLLDPPSVPRIPVRFTPGLHDVVGSKVQRNFGSCNRMLNSLMDLTIEDGTLPVKNPGYINGNA